MASVFSREKAHVKYMNNCAATASCKIMMEENGEWRRRKCGNWRALTKELREIFEDHTLSFSSQCRRDTV